MRETTNTTNGHDQRANVEARAPLAKLAQTTRKILGSITQELFPPGTVEEGSQEDAEERGREAPVVPNDGEIWLLRTEQGPVQAIYDELLDAWRQVNLTHVYVHGEAVRRVDVGWFDFDYPPNRNGEAPSYPAIFFRPFRRGSYPPLNPWHALEFFPRYVLRLDLGSRRLSRDITGYADPTLSNPTREQLRATIESMIPHFEKRYRSQVIRWAGRFENVPRYLVFAHSTLFDSWASRFFGQLSEQPRHQGRDLQWSRLAVDPELTNMFS